MKKRTPLQTFSLSFLDILACALGGVLVLLLLSFADGSRITRSYQTTIAEMQARIAATVGRLETTTTELDAVSRESEANERALAEAVAHNRQLQKALEELHAETEAAEAALNEAKSAGNSTEAALARAQSEIDALRKASDTLRQAQANLVGLRGPLRNVAFVFDTSGSMATPRFDDYKATLKSWVTHLPMRRLAVIDFDNNIRVFRPNLVDATPENRAAACEFIDGFSARGMTDTLGALQRAFAMEGLDTIVLLSDGEPTLPHPRDGGRPSAADIAKNIALVEQWLQQRNASGEVVINCVAMGNYFNTAYGEFLQRIAADHGGVFIGM